MKIKILFHDGMYEVQPVPAVGACKVGRGRTMMAALGSYFHNMQRELNIEIEVDESAQHLEMARRRRELALR